MLNLLYRTNAEKVAAEIIDGEAIIINVETGNYYNTEGIGGWVWERCSEGLGFDAIADAACSQFEVARDVIENDLKEFFESLAVEELVTATATNDTAPAEPAFNASQPRQPYRKPGLVAYRDLKDLLALDPPMPRLGGTERPAALAGGPR